MAGIYRLCGEKVSVGFPIEKSCNSVSKRVVGHCCSLANVGYAWSSTGETEREGVGSNGTRFAFSRHIDMELVNVVFRTIHGNYCLGGCEIVC
jgi:hypothetical protein